MKTTRSLGYRLTIVGAFCLAGVFAYLYSSERGERQLAENRERLFMRLARPGAAAVLRDCRVLIATHSQLPKDGPGRSNDDRVLILSGSEEFAAHVPASVRLLSPVYVRVTPELADIRLAGNRRGSLLAFAQGGRQKGSVQLLDGLWYYDGHLGPTNSPLLAESACQTEMGLW